MPNSSAAWKAAEEFGRVYECARFGRDWPKVGNTVTQILKQIIQSERKGTMNRRDFIATGLVYGVTAVAAPNVALAGASGAEPAHKFKLNYAPHFGMFKLHTGDDLVAQLQFFREQGFTALEDNGLPDRPVADQEKIGKALADL